MEHRHLQKILGTESGLEPFAATGENLELLMETLREVQQCRAGWRFLREKFRLDLLVSPAVFNRLLAIPEIDTVETPNKRGEVDRSSRKVARGPEDPVSIADVNVILQELNRDLAQIRDLESGEFSNLLLAGEMTGDLLQPAAETIASLRALDSPLTGYFFSAWKARGIEKDFRRSFPRSDAAHPLRNSLDQMERELGFYKLCLEINQKWRPLSLDLFHIIRNDGLTQVMENIQRLGSRLWNVVYNGQRLKASIELVGINFGDIRTLFEKTGPMQQE